MHAEAVERTNKAQLPYLVKGLALIALCLLVYWPTFGHGFIWDDNDYVYNNPNLNDTAGLVRIWTQPSTSPQYYPLVFTALWIEHQLFDDWAGGYHIVTVAFHLLASLLLWLLLSRLKLPGSWWVAAFFAVHPVHVETAAWITEHKNVMSAFFYFAAAIAYIRFDDPTVPIASSKRNWLFYFVAVFLFILALLCKTVVATLPAGLLLVYWWKRHRLCAKDVWPTVPMFLLGVFFGLFTATMEYAHVGASGGEWSLSVAERVLLAGELPWFYLSKLVLPIGLCFSYERWPVEPGDLLSWLWPISVVLAVGLAYYFRKRIGFGIFAGLCFFGGSLFPVLGFLNVFPFRYAWAADHFNYIPSVGMLAAIIGAIIWRLDRSRFQTAGRVALACILLCFASIAWVRTWQFADRETLWRHTLRINPNSYLATINLANMRFGQGQVGQAESMATRALTLADRPFEAHDLLGAIEQVNNDRSAAIEHYAIASKMQPSNYKLRYNLAFLLHAEGRYEQVIATVAPSEQWMLRQPNLAYLFASSFFQLGRPHEAAQHAELAARSRGDRETSELLLDIYLAIDPDADVEQLKEKISTRTFGEDQPSP